MRAILLAAGLGTRLRPVTDTVPKCLVPIHGRPLLGLWFDLLFESGAVERALVNTHWLAPRVEAFVAASPWRERVDLVMERELLGTAGTIIANRSWFGSAPVLVAHADNLTDFNVSNLIRAHTNRPTGTAITMLAFHTDSPETSGILELDARGVVRAFHEKVADPPGNLANAAVYIFEPEVADFAASLGKRVLDLSTEVIPHFLGSILSVPTRGYHRDIGSPEALRLARAEWRPAVDKV
ncbi:MAG: nucleotidyltransferase family protein [Acetobacteraceae bacterium]